MAHYASNRYNYWGQFGLLAAFAGGGLVLGGLLSMVPLLGKVNFFDSKNLMQSLLVPENASALRWSQFLSTLCLFFLPPVLYAKICHVQPWRHLGFTGFNQGRPVNMGLLIAQAILGVVIITSCLPLVSMLQTFTESLPWSKGMMAKFKAAEEAYNQQVMIMAKMDSFGEYLVALVIVALLPAVFEETLFRGAIQNLLSRGLKQPIVAIMITSIVFSAVHGSYLGFLSRFALGFVLGWLYYRTGNIWLNIIAHFFNNAMAITALYISKLSTGKIDPAAAEDHFPIWAGLASIAIAVGLVLLFEKISKATIDRPGEEVLIPAYDRNNPFSQDVA